MALRGSKRKATVLRPNRGKKKVKGQPKDGRVIKHGQAYTQFRWEMYQRAGGQCEVIKGTTRCGRSAPFYSDPSYYGGAVHHLNGRGLGGSKRDDSPDVTVWACGQCHDVIHHPKAVPPKVKVQP